MGGVTLELGERWSAWHPDVRRARWEQEGFGQDVLVVLGPHAPGAVLQARNAACDAMSYRGRHVLPLLGVEATGRKVAWLYPLEVVVSLRRIPRGGLGHRGALEVVLALARTLGDLPHPGPSPDHVLIDDRGTVRIAGFVGPWATEDAWSAPRSRLPGSDSWAETAYQVGLLYAWLLGTSVPPAHDAEEHAHLVRRALIDVLSAPGAPISDAQRQLFSDLLAWDPRDRPTAREVVQRAQQGLRSGGGPSITELVTEQFSTWLQPHRRAPAPAPEPGDFTLDVDHTQEAPRSVRTLDGEGRLPEIPEEDDPTVDSELGIVPGSDRTPTSAIEFGSLPLRVGPPAEAARVRPRLPDGFLGSEETRTLREERADLPDPADPPPWLTWLGVVLLGLAVGMLVWLLLG